MGPQPPGRVIDVGGLDSGQQALLERVGDLLDEDEALGSAVRATRFGSGP